LNAGLGTDRGELARVVRQPLILLVGTAANLLVPIALLWLLCQALRCWHNADEAQHLLLGLAIVAAMPVAGSSTAWAQQAQGNVSLSLGLVIASTLLSPLTTPLTLAGVCSLVTGGYADALGQLSGRGTELFLLACVVLPSLAGMALRGLLGEHIHRRLKAALKQTNTLVLLILCYANASAALPQIVAQPDWDFLALVLGVVVVLCVSAFAVGWCLARCLGLDVSQQRSLMFALGMNNNGTGMVLAGASLSSLPWATLPVLLYNLVQHLVAGGVSRTFGRTGSRNAEG
jgi:BASS family bile acid:Na+ symporter